MADPAVYTEKLSAFSRMLRLEGLAVGPQETADACRILIDLGLSDRNTVKTALRTVYAKSRDEQLTFDRVFDGFFLSEEAMRAQAAEQAARERELEQARQQAEQELNLNGRPLELDEAQREAYAMLPEESRERLRRFMDRYKGSADRNPNLYSNFIHSVFAKTILEQQMKMEDAALAAPALDPELGLMYRDISQFRDTELPRAIEIIRQVSQQINSELAARRGLAGRSRKLDFRRTIRKGLETGGTFYRLQFRRKPIRRRRLVMLCDVSGSMLQFSEFALRFIQALNNVSESSRVFLFSETVSEADAFSLQNMDLFRSYVKELGLFGRGTNLGAALEELCNRQPPVFTAATTLIILSDAKTVDQNRAMEALVEAKRQAGRVLWLNPIPEGKWQYLRSTQAFASVCSMASCATLNALASACRRLTAI